MKNYDETQHTQTCHDCAYVLWVHHWELLPTGSLAMRCTRGRVEQWTQTRAAHG